MADSGRGRLARDDLGAGWHRAAIPGETDGRELDPLLVAEPIGGRRLPKTHDNLQPIAHEDQGATWRVPSVLSQKRGGSPNIASGPQRQVEISTVSNPSRRIEILEGDALLDLDAGDPSFEQAVRDPIPGDLPIPKGQLLLDIARQRLSLGAPSAGEEHAHSARLRGPKPGRKVRGMGTTQLQPHHPGDGVGVESHEMPWEAGTGSPLTHRSKTNRHPQDAN